MTDAPNEQNGEIQRISGPVVTAVGISPALYEVVQVGHLQLLGEVIQIREQFSLIQVYEETSGLKPGEPVRQLRRPLSVELGPGLLGSVFDGLQRPLPELVLKSGQFITRGLSLPALDREKVWHFTPAVKEGDKATAGAALGFVQESASVKHVILLPPDIAEAQIIKIAEGDYRVEDPIGQIQRTGSSAPEPITMLQRWPVRVPRPVKSRPLVDRPLITGQRILDTFFPLAKGGTAGIPGPFGSGKTVTQQQLAKWSDADVIVYVGCGERGNEMTEVLTEFPELKDPRNGLPLMQRTILVANTSNMPVAAREASVYAGITLAEYYRDMGLDVALMADSTSRWAEAMREISARLEEMPGEEGYPAYLSTRLAQFYERAGSAVTLGGKNSSITVIGAVSPPGGDFSEPVTQATLRIVKVFWGLDAKLAHRRHFPSINWLTSYSLNSRLINPWFVKNVAKDFVALREEAMALLQAEAELQEVVQLVGADALPEDERVTLESARLLRDGFLQQSAYHEVDSYCALPKQYKLLKLILGFHEMAMAAIKKGAAFSAIAALPSVPRLTKVRFEKDFDKELEATEQALKADFASLGATA